MRLRVGDYIQDNALCNYLVVWKITKECKDGYSVTMVHPFSTGREHHLSKEASATYKRMPKLKGVIYEKETKDI